MVYVTPVYVSGTKRWSHLQITSPEDVERLKHLCKKLGMCGRVELKQDARGVHVDITEHQRELALRYGACEL